MILRGPVPIASFRNLWRLDAPESYRLLLRSTEKIGSGSLFPAIEVTLLLRGQHLQGNAHGLELEARHLAVQLFGDAMDRDRQPLLRPGDHLGRQGLVGEEI